MKRIENIRKVSCTHTKYYLAIIFVVQFCVVPSISLTETVKDITVTLDCKSAGKDCFVLDFFFVQHLVCVFSYHLALLSSMMIITICIVSYNTVIAF